MSELRAAIVSKSAHKTRSRTQQPSSGKRTSFIGPLGDLEAPVASVGLTSVVGLLAPVGS